MLQSRINYSCALVLSMMDDDLVVISPDVISQQKVVDFVTHSSAGGIATFIGYYVFLYIVQMEFIH